MKHSKKILALAMSIAVVASIAAAGTLAYLTGTGSVENTFNVGTQGKVDITLDEAPVDKNGKATEGDRVQKNEYENLLPNQLLDKDPTVHVQANSAKSYVFAYIQNGLGSYGEIIGLDEEVWIPCEELSGMFRYAGEKLAVVNGVKQDYVPATTGVLDLEDVFEQVRISKEADNTSLQYLKDGKIIVSAFAIQADNLATESQTAVQVATEEAAAYFAKLPAVTMIEAQVPVEP